MTEDDVLVRLNVTGGCASATITSIDNCDVNREVYPLYPMSLAWLGGPEMAYAATGYESFVEYDNDREWFKASLKIFETTLGENSYNEAFRTYSSLFAALLPPFVPQYGRLGLDALGGPKPDGKGARHGDRRRGSARSPPGAARVLSIVSPTP